ncbi:hypothetical protein PGT21_033921 [Puccinia graminis f. sp. tritici]|uniref:Uncharacterized protein n=1 Tax=Puccinia graminis f. sp. tritici TaxID=56615 RepID=A0A5B0R4A1_PUCGR|nr:hypothetical protein PGT21_033921 [Puccinia graminis f. sp. tritici]
MVLQASLGTGPSSAKKSPSGLGQSQTPDSPTASKQHFHTTTTCETQLSHTTPPSTVHLSSTFTNHSTKSRCMPQQFETVKLAAWIRSSRFYGPAVGAAVELLLQLYC